MNPALSAWAQIDRRVEIVSGTDSPSSSPGTVRDLRPAPFVVFLGEPGMGKSTTLGIEASVDGSRVQKVRQLITSGTAGPRGTLFLDALDEFRIGGDRSDKVHRLASAITAARVTRWRLTCRSEDWRKEADIAALDGTTGGQPIVVAQLMPLDEDEASAILVTLGESDPGAFLKKSIAMGARGFLENPLSLKLLHKAVTNGTTWPRTRYDLFDRAVRRLADEANPEHKSNSRSPPDAIVGAAEKACLLLLVSGARAIWRSSGAAPTETGDEPEYLLAHSLDLDPRLSKDCFNTSLFRGDGESFEPMHRTVAEYLAGRALARSVLGKGGAPAFPLSRGIALVTGRDGRPPTELRGVFAWFSAHLSRMGDEHGAERLVKADPLTVLTYGDAAAFSTGVRRRLLAAIEDGDPHFLSSHVGITAVGGLAGEDLNEDFVRILEHPPDGHPQVFRTVCEVLASSTPAPAILLLLHRIALDPARPKAQRSAAIRAWLTTAPDIAVARRTFLTDLERETPSADREDMRMEIAADLGPGVFDVSELKSLLYGSWRFGSPRSESIYRFGRLLEDQELPDLFDEPLTSWLPGLNLSPHNQIDRILDRALAVAIRTTADLTAGRLWRWTRNACAREWEGLDPEASKALLEWLDEQPGRHVAYFDAILADVPASELWRAYDLYNRIVGRAPSADAVRLVLEKETAAPTEEETQRLLELAVKIVLQSDRAHEAYWDTYDHVERHSRSETLLAQLTTVPIPPWVSTRLREKETRAREHARWRDDNIRDLGNAVDEVRSGKRLGYLQWAAERYFDQFSSRDGEPVGLARVLADTNEPITEAIVAGWKSLVTQGVVVDARALGKANGEGRRYNFEQAMLAGLDRLRDEQLLQTTPASPLVPLVVLNSSHVVRDSGARDILAHWAVERLNGDADAGANSLFHYWLASVDAGATELSGLWFFVKDRVQGDAVARALEMLLQERPGMNARVLLSALKGAIGRIPPERLIALADAALARIPVPSTTEGGAWSLVAFALDPERHAVAFLEKQVGPDGFPMAEDSRYDSLLDAFCDTPLSGRADVLRSETIVRAFGASGAPDDVMSGPVTRRAQLSDAVRRALDSLTRSSAPDAGAALERLGREPALAAWHSHLVHGREMHARALRDSSFEHPKPEAIYSALEGGAPVSAADLRAIVVEELMRLRAELHTSDTTPWKRYWNIDPTGKPTTPLIENECRDHLLDRLRDRIRPYGIAIALGEARRAENTRADMLVLTGAGRNLPVEIKRHFHRDVWTAPDTQLRQYAETAGADGLGIYLVLWFGTASKGSKPPRRPDGRDGPTSATEMKAMLRGDLAAVNLTRFDVIVFDVSPPA